VHSLAEQPTAHGAGRHRNAQRVAPRVPVQVPSCPRKPRVGSPDHRPCLGESVNPAQSTMAIACTAHLLNDRAVMCYHMNDLELVQVVL
jgi:hypothetical protein